jgi:hypothetical protein
MCLVGCLTLTTDPFSQLHYFGSLRTLGVSVGSSKLGTDVIVFGRYSRLQNRLLSLSPKRIVSTDHLIHF